MKVLCDKGQLPTGQVKYRFRNKLGVMDVEYIKLPEDPPYIIDVQKEFGEGLISSSPSVFSLAKVKTDVKKKKPKDRKTKEVKDVNDIVEVTDSPPISIT